MEYPITEQMLSARRSVLGSANAAAPQLGNTVQPPPGERAGSNGQRAYLGS